MQLTILDKTQNRVTTKDAEGIVRTVHPDIYQKAKRLGFPRPVGRFAELLREYRAGQLNSEDFVAASAAEMQEADDRKV